MIQPLSLGSGAKAQSNYSGDRVVTALTVNGVVQPNGTYGSSASEATTVDDAHFTGTVTVGLHQQAKILSVVFEELPAAVLNEVNHTIQLTVPPDTNVTGLAPSYTLLPRSNLHACFRSDTRFLHTAELYGHF